MKKLILVFVALFTLCFYSCKEEPKKTIIQPQDVPLSERPILSLPNSTNNAVTAAGVAHYICPNNCKGGTSSTKGTCPVCNLVLAHNQGFHNTPVNKNPTTTTVPAPTSGPNAAGQYHYTCSKGCAGGGDLAGKCSSCSGDLAHNAAFHN